MMAVVLKRVDFREFDQIISLYTPERGKIEALARGVKKITSKNAAHLEPFCFVLVEIVPGREIDHLTKVVPIDSFSSIRRDLNKGLAAGYVVSLLDKLTEVGEADRKIWEATLSWLRNLANLANPALEALRSEVQADGFSTGLRLANLVSLVDGYIVTLLSCLGMKPIVDKCVVCGKSFQEMIKAELNVDYRLLTIDYSDDKTKISPKSVVHSPKSGIYFSGGGLICPTCLVQKQKIGEEIAACGLKEISDWHLLLKGDWRRINEYPLDEGEYRRVHRLVYEFALYHSERKIGDWIKVSSL